MHFENLPRAAFEIYQCGNQRAGACEDQIQRVGNGISRTIADEHVADHAAGGGGKEREKNKPDDVEIALARDGAADDAVENDTYQIQAAVERIDGLVH